LNFSEKLEIDIWEILNALHDEQTNILSCVDPSTHIEGWWLFHKGYLVQNQLDVPYLKAVMRVAGLYSMLDHDESEQERGVVEVIQIDKQGNLFQKIDLSHAILKDNEMFEENMSKRKLKSYFRHERSKGQKIRW
jgi:hypothetical protein